MRYWKFSQKTKLKQNFFGNSEKEVGNFLKTGTIVSGLLASSLSMQNIMLQIGLTASLLAPLLGKVRQVLF